MRKFIAAAIQLNSQDNKEENLKNISYFVEEAFLKGAKFIVLPETSTFNGHNCKSVSEVIPGGESFKVFSELAKKYKVWLDCGSIYEKNDDDKRPYNTSILFNPQGEMVAKYRKTHLFDVKLGDMGIKESRRNCPGEKIVVADTKEIGSIGLSICYDIRFGEMYRLMALNGAEIFAVSADFTANTGEYHWETLLKARAIENGCYVVAANQTGEKVNFNSFGNSMIIDPWGKVIARAKDEPCVITAEIDLDYVESVRKQIFTLENRREDIYSLKYNK